MPNITFIMGLITGVIWFGITVKILKYLIYYYTNFKLIAKEVSNGKLIVCIWTLLLIVWGCSSPSVNVSNTLWKTYTNSRYGFEFPYPSHWEALAAPSNNDGMAFVSPRNKAVEIRGWASNQLSAATTREPATHTSTSPNFKTVQGVSGVLLVEVGNPLSSMQLTLEQNQVRYYWQGQSPSPEFQDYYRLFYYIAQQYQIPQKYN